MNGLSAWLRALFLALCLALPAAALADAGTAAAVTQPQATAAQHEHMADPPRDRDDLSAFFIIGIIINVVMAVSFAVWAVKEWRASSRK